MSRHKGPVPYHKDRKVVIISILGIVLATFIFIQLNGSPTGYMTYEPRYNLIDVKEIVRGGTIMSVLPADGKGFSLNSLEISGKVMGDGAARVFLYTGDGWKLVYSNRDFHGDRPGFIILGDYYEEKSVYGELSDEVFVVKTQKSNAPEDLSVEDVWQVPLTCWETCRLEGFASGDIRLFFDVDSGSAFYLDKISVS